MATEALRPAPTPGARAKMRLVFRKGGSLRWLSHHDLLRTFERMLRRAQLPVHYTSGFHPHARLVFALSLPLGVVGLSEILDLELDEELKPDEVLQRVRAECPPGLEILDAQKVPLRCGLRVSGLCYGLNVPTDRVPTLRHQLREVLNSPRCPIERTHPSPRIVDIRPFLRDLRLDEQTGRLEIDLHLNESGTARPDEVLRLLGLSDLFEAGVLLERVRLELQETSLTDTPTHTSPTEGVDPDSEDRADPEEISFKDNP